MLEAAGSSPAGSMKDRLTLHLLETSYPEAKTPLSCKEGGWQTYGIFTNQGDCVSYVATGGKNRPAGSP
jgi:hypothetical protein